MPTAPTTTSPHWRPGRRVPVVLARRRLRVLKRVPVLVLAAGVLLLTSCTQQDATGSTKPKASAVVPTDANVTTTAASAAPPSVATSETNIRTIDDVRSTLTADGTLDVDQADCVVGNLKVSIGEPETVKAFAATDLSAATAGERDAVITAFTACVPKEALVRPVGASVKQVAATKGVTVSDAEADCITKQLAAAVSYDDLLVASADGKGGLTDATATQAVRSCVSPEAFASLGLTG